MIRIGYVGVNTALPTASKTFRLANYTEERMLETASANIQALRDILAWNLWEGITLFRITSDLIPFASHPVNSGRWKMALHEGLAAVGEFMIGNGMRVSMHPGQYTVLNSPNEEYYQNSLRDLEYHDSVLSLMGLDAGHRIIIHGGGAYGDKAQSTLRLIERIRSLPQGIRARLALENDERVFSAEEILSLCREVRMPGVFDVFHHQVLPSLAGASIREIIVLFGETWPGERQKIHYSNQDPNKGRGAHSQTIDVERFAEFYEDIKDLELDIMLETKDKQESVLKLRGLIAAQRGFTPK